MREEDSESSESSESSGPLSLTWREFGAQLSFVRSPEMKNPRWLTAQSQIDLAEGVGTHAKRIGWWENGTKLPTEEQFKLIVSGLKNFHRKGHENDPWVIEQRAKLESAFSRAINGGSSESTLPSITTTEGPTSGLVATPVVASSMRNLLKRWAEHRHRTLLDYDREVLAGRFVNLMLLPERSDEAGAQPQRFDSLHDLLVKHPTLKAWVLAGEPGGGKSTLMRAHELRALSAWLNAEQVLPAPDTELCVTVELRRLSAGQVLGSIDGAFARIETWLASQWALGCEDACIEGAPSWADLPSMCRVRLLLDGLNEIDAANEAERTAAVSMLSEWALRAHRRTRRLAPVFTVRVLNYSQTLDSPELEVRRAEVQPLDRNQIRDFCTKAFGGDNANPVWTAIRADPDLGAFFGNPFNLRLQCDMFTQPDGLARVVSKRADLLAARTWARLQELTKGHRKELAPLAGPVQLLSTGDRERIGHQAGWAQADMLWKLPNEGELIRGLDAWAYEMHFANKGAPGVATAPLAKRHVDERVQEDWWRAVLAFDIVRREGDSYRFRHHLYQEFFAARFLATRASPESWPSFAAPELVEKPVAAWEPLPLPEVSPWQEAARMAVQMGADPLALLRKIRNDGNEPLAARALAGIAATPAQAALRRDVQLALIERSQNADLPMRLRLEAGLALGDLGDRIRYEPFNDAHGTECLLPRDEFWRAVPPGRYPVGEQSLQVTLTLGFKMAFAPVTNAEFAWFVQAGGYIQPGQDQPPPWWPQSEAALDFWHGRLRDAGWADALDFWRGLDPEQFERYCVEDRLSPESVADYQRLRSMPKREYEEEREARVKPKGLPREPEWWRTADFKNGLQPVVGVNLYEAQAYVNWLNCVRPLKGEFFALPSEAQWEAAARGAEGREWPWGPQAPTEAKPRMNYSRDGRIGRTSPVAQWPDGATPAGIHDLAGNVWEWTVSAYPADHSQDPQQMLSSASENERYRAVRGGSWYVRPEGCRAAVRNWSRPDYRYDYLGFRLVVCPIQNPGP